MTDLHTALAAWTDAIGAANVHTGEQERQAAETATFATSQQIPAILQPGNRAEVQACLRIANEWGIPVYPVSSGRNWGYGSRVPAGNGSVLLDLRRLNQIVGFSAELAYVTVEPGVTQRQLHEYLQTSGAGLWMDASGSSPECSLIGNVMERGFGHTPMGDHFASVCGFEVVLPSGECIETGFARFAGTATAPLYRWGVGPSLDGIFSQSNFGIVTRMTIWLMPAPEYFQAFFFSCEADEDLAGVLDALRPLRLSGTLRSAVHIGNDYKVLGGIQQYPWDLTGGATPLQRPALRELAQKLNFGAWNGSGGLYGTRAQVAEARRLVQLALKGRVRRLQFLDDRKLRFAARFAKLYRMSTGWDLTRALELVRPVYGLLQGIPTAKPLAGAYWRKRMSAPADPDPDRDGCGLLWYAPVCPLDGRHALKLSAVTNDIMLKHGFEPMISLTMVTERAMACVISIIYDRAIEGEDRRAMACYQELLTTLTNHGYHSYRLGIQSMSEMEGPDGYQRLLRSIKTTLDPRNILAPQRYEGARSAAQAGS